MNDDDKRESAAMHLEIAAESVRLSSATNGIELHRFAKLAARAALKSIQRENGILKTTKHPSERLDAAVAWLNSYLEGAGWVHQDEVYNDGGRAGFSKQLLNRASEAPGIRVEGEFRSRHKVWFREVGNEKEI